MVQLLHKYFTTKNLFLFFLGFFSFSLMLGSRVRYISLIALIFFGILLLYKERKNEATLLQGYFVALLFASFASSFFAGETFVNILSHNKNIFLSFLLFVILSLIKLTEQELITYFFRPFLYAFLILFTIAIYKYFFIATEFDRFRIIGSVNKGAIYITFVLSVALPFIYHKDRGTRLLSRLSAFLACVGVIIAASRSAWITLLVILLLFYFLFLSKKWTIKYIIFTVISLSLGIYLAYLINSELIIHKLNNFFVEEYRGRIWLAAWDSYILNKNYLFGIGTGNFKSVSLSSYIPNWFQYIGQVHNMYLHFLTENGIIGLFAFIGILITYLKKAFLSYKSNLFFLCGILSCTNVILASFTQNAVQKELGFCFFLILSISLITLNKNMEEK